MRSLVLSLGGLFIGIAFMATDAGAQSGEVTYVSPITCANPSPPFPANCVKISWSGTWEGTGAWDVVGCYAPVYAYDSNNETQSPSTYYRPDPSSSTSSSVEPGNTDGSEDDVPFPKTVTDSGGSMHLVGILVWFEWGNWVWSGQFGKWCWTCEGGTNWCWREWDGGGCFARGTRLLTPEGTKPIEQFKAGDWILSAPQGDPKAPAVARRVKEVIRTRGQLLDIAVRGQAVQATREHPFYVKGEGWTPAAALAVGDLLRSHDNQWLPVESIVKAGESQVYNVRVEEDGTFFVGDRDWGFSLWVYGACNRPKTPAEQLAQSKAARSRFPNEVPHSRR